MTTTLNNLPRPDDAFGGSDIERLAGAIRESLSGRHNARAARMVMTARSQDLLPTGDGLRLWLLEQFDTKGFHEVVDGFARMDSPCCHSGFDTCDACEGTGFLDAPCRACVGLGEARCAFCGGASLLPYDAVPSSLRLAVLQARVALAKKALPRIIQAARPVPDPDTAVAHWTKHIHNCEKLLAVFENAKQTLVQWPGQIKGIGGYLESLMASAWAARASLTDALAGLSAAWAKRADAEARPARARDLSAFYAGLLTGGFQNTGLAHPFLFDEDRNSAPPGSSASSEGVPGHRLEGDEPKSPPSRDGLQSGAA
ncbi:MAG: hypothetical protein QM770_17610 [Tepidisphaeraceae bacterium]